MTEFGELHCLLAERGLSLREAARRVGCTPGYLSNAAHDRKPLTPSVARELATSALPAVRREATRFAARIGVSR
jgi:transcriptional regulator with XRE-family HTH domain